MVVCAKFGLAAEVMSILQSLAERSLVQIEDGDPPRWRLPESAREYALEALDAKGERRDAHLAHALALAAHYEQAEDEHFVLNDADWLASWTPDLDNLRAALDWASAQEPVLALRLVGAATTPLSMLALSQQLRRRAEALAPAVEHADLMVAGRYWFARAHLQMNFGDEIMFRCAGKAEAIFGSLGNQRLQY